MSVKSVRDVLFSQHRLGDIGKTAMAIIALIQTGENPQSPALKEALDGLAVTPGRQRPPLVWLALAAAGKLSASETEMLMRRQNLDGSWDSLTETVLGVHLLTELGYGADSNRLRQTLDKVYPEQCADGSFGDLQSTALVLGALSKAGLSATHPTVLSAGRWLGSHFDRLHNESTPEAVMACQQYLRWKNEKV